MAFIETLSNSLRPFSFRGKARLLHKFCPRSAEKSANIFGYEIKLDLADYIQRSVYLGAFEPVESRQVRSYLKGGMTFVDVGANVGYYTLMAASLVGEAGRVISFEPSPYAFARLQETIFHNRLSTVHLVQAGLGDVAGEVELCMPVPGNHTPSMVPQEGGRPIQVPVVRLDDYLEQNNIDEVHLMKIDVEGFEPNVINGSLRHLREGKIRAILCEFNSDWLSANDSSSLSLFNMILDCGFKCRKALDPSASLQNLFFTFA
ncbi:MAG TPA: FkbM family methyltransferase [Pyrinomonadaceae bacterium]|nr:FkbM family methyltransferase [Pyrinomonadaceae bacterium]